MGAIGPNPDTLLGATHAEPTRVRYGVLAFLCALSFILYIDRICIGEAKLDMKGELDISDTAMGFVFAAFTVAYGLFEVPMGRWGDRHGSRGVLTRIVLWWSLFTALTGCVWKFSLDSGYELELLGEQAIPLALNSFVALLVVRFLFGAGEAGALPNSARVLSRWFPPDGRGPAQGLINTAMLVGGASTPVVASYLIDQVGWRWAFVLFGGLGLVWAAAFYTWFRDDPARHPWVNPAELHLISSGAALEYHHAPVPWRRVLASANVWLMGFIISCAAFVSYVYFFWYPTYLTMGRGVERIEAGWLASLVLAGGATGSVLGGYVSDWLVRRLGNRRRAYRLMGCGGMGMAALSLVLAVQCESPVATALLTSLASLSASSMLASWWSVVMEISGKHIGALFGLMNSLGVPGAVASQIFFGWYADWRKDLGYTGRDQWDPGFYVCAGALLLGAVGWLFVDPSRSAVEGPVGSDGPMEAEA
jgi:MFS family permease